MRALERVGFGLLLAAGALVMAGEYFDAPWMFRLALVAIGLMGCLGGIRTVRKGEVVGGFYEANYLERLSGLSAWLMGGILLLAGTIIAGLGALDLYSGGQAGVIMTRVVLNSPRGIGAVLALSGFIVMVFGLTRVLSGTAKASGSFSPHVELSFRLAGTVATVVGLVMLVLGMVLVIAPDLSLRLLQRALSLAELPIPQRLP